MVDDVAEGGGQIWADGGSGGKRKVEVLEQN